MAVGDCSRGRGAASDRIRRRARPGRTLHIRSPELCMPIQVDSEIGRLRRVLVHRPGREIDWMVPSMMESLLFDDILDGDEAREEHDLFRQIFQQAGVEVLDAQDLLADVLRRRGASRKRLARGARGRVRRAVQPGAPARRAAAGRARLGAGRGHPRAPPRSADAGRPQLFELNPVPNYFFQRDPQVVMGNRVVISSMATDAREREPLLARALFEHHPALAGYRGAVRDRRAADRRAAAQPELPLSEPGGGRRAGGQPGDRPGRASPSAPTGAASRCWPSICGGGDLASAT